MATNDDDQTSLDGCSPGDRFEEAGYEGLGAWGANIGAASPSAEEMMNQWMERDGHCRNIMDPLFTQFGIGYAFEEESSFQRDWAQAFAN